MPSFVRKNDAVATAATSLTFSIDGTATDGLLLGAVNANDASGVTAAYNGDAMTELQDAGPSPSFQHIASYALPAPDAGTNNLVFTFSAATDCVGCALLYSDRNTTTPYENYTSQSSSFGGTTTPSIDVTSASGAKVVDIISYRSDPTTATPGAGQTQRVNRHGGDDFIGMLASDEDGAASTTMSWTLGAACPLIHAGLSLPAAAGGDVLMPQICM